MQIFLLAILPVNEHELSTSPEEVCWHVSFPIYVNLRKYQIRQIRRKFPEKNAN